MSRTFSDIIDAIGIAALAKHFGKDESHVRVMKTRDSVPPDYWPQLIEAAAAMRPALTYPELVALRNSRRAAPTGGGNTAVMSA